MVFDVLLTFFLFISGDVPSCKNQRGAVGIIWMTLPSSSGGCVCVCYSLQVEAKIFELQEAMVERGFSDVEIEEKVRDMVL